MKPIYKILIVIGIIIIVGLAIYLGWRAITAPSSPIESPSDEGVSSETGVETEINLKKLSDQPVFNFWVMPDTKNIFYLTLDGKVFNAKESEDSLLSNQVINALNGATISPDNQKILASFGDPRQPQWGIFDLIDRTWRPLPAEILNVTWGENADALIGFVRSQNKISLNSVDVSKNPPQINVIIANLNLYDVKLSWQSPDQLLIMEKPAAEYGGVIWSLNTKTKEIKTIAGPELGLTAVWSDAARTMLVFSAPNQFRIITTTSTLPFFQTLPEKCGAASVIYCFIPTEVPTGVKLPDDYLMKKFYSIDGLYSINPEGGQIRKLVTSGTELLPAIDGLYPQHLDNSIYFINRFDGYLYKLEL